MEDIRINGLSADEWESLSEPQQPTTEELTGLGVIQGSEEPQQEAEPSKPKMAERQDYEKLGYWQTLGDEAIAGGTELANFFLPKSKELNYTPRTKAGEAFKTFTKWVWGIGGLFLGGEAAGIAKGAAAAKGLTGAAKVAGGAEAILKGNKFFKTGKTGLKAFGVNALNIGTQGVLQGAILDATIHDENEGRVADLFGDTDNALINYLQTDPNDSTLEAKFKNVIDGAFASIAINGVMSAATPVAERLLKNVKWAKDAADAGKEVSETVAQDIATDTTKLEKMADTADLVDNVRAIKEEADATGEDASQMIADRFHTDNIEEGQAILKTIEDGEDIFIHEDGTWDIKVNTWEDAYKVSPEGYKKQLDAMDVINGEEFAGNTALNHQDEAVKSTWVNRGWIGEAEDLTQSNANKVAKNYTDKWQIDNNVKVEFVDGLTINGKAVEGNTTQTTFLGKNKKSTKAAQTKIDKKKLEIQQIKDKITQLEGGNEEVSDPLDILKEKLRIAQNELKDLKNIPQPQKLSNITIKIDKNAKNPYATLRSELEHARDIAKGEVPKEEGKHFARYNGANEGEVASDYTYKKSVGRNNTLNPEEIVKDTNIPEVKEPVNEVVDTQPKQLTIDFSAVKNTDDIVNTVVEQGMKTVDDIENVIEQTIKHDPEISGYTWKAIAEDGDKMAEFMDACDALDLTKAVEQAINMNDVKTMDAITVKVMAVQKQCAKLADRLAELGKNPNFDVMASIIDTIDQIARYTKATGSASGRSLNARKFINRAVQTFGSLRMSELTKAGIQDLADLLTVDIRKSLDLNFTRGTKLNPAQIKAELMSEWLQNTDNDLVQLILNDETIANEFNQIIDKAIKSNGKLDINKEIINAITKADYEDVYNALKLTDNPNNKIKTLKNWVNQQGGMTSFYVHNLLSGVGTLAKNVISGGMNTVYFPAKKIIAGYMNDMLGFGGGAELRAEGWNTYQNLMSSWKEAWSLGAAAFKNGEGQLSMAKDTMALADGEVFRGFRDWKFDFSTPEGIWEALQNFHSVMTRAMGASDEFMSQLNYRSIIRSKSLANAQKSAAKFGITDEKTIAEIADSLFNSAFDSSGRPLDLEAFAEAKDILYQVPLNGKMWDNKAGQMTQVRGQSVATGIANSINQQAAKNPFLKIIFPFVKTGANILQQNLEHNGIYALLSNNQRQLLMSNTKQGALARSQVAFGMFSFMAAAGLAMSGGITGSAPPDPKERQALFETGWKPYSIRVGNQFISYQGYEPIQTILGFAADSVNIYGNMVNSEDDKKWQHLSQRVFATAINNFLDKAAFRTGLKQMEVLTDPEKYADWAKSIAQTGQGFLPNSAMVRNISSVGKRDITAPEGYDRIFNNYFNRGLGDYRRDVFGNRQDNYGLLVTNAAPDKGNEPEYAELENLAQYGFTPSDITKTITDTALKYKEFKDPDTGKSVYDSMQEELSTISIDGKTLQEAVRDLVTSEEYANLPLGVNMNGYKYSSSEATKLNAIRDIFVEYNNAAMQNVIKEYGDIYINRKNRTMSEAIEEVNLEKMNQSIQDNLNNNLTNQILQFGQ